MVQALPVSASDTMRHVRKEIALISKKGTRPGALICISAYPFDCRYSSSIPVNRTAIDFNTEDINSTEFCEKVPALSNMK
jgi:hypothetical protein